MNLEQVKNYIEEKKVILEKGGFIMTVDLLLDLINQEIKLIEEIN